MVGNMLGGHPFVWGTKQGTDRSIIIWSVVGFLKASVALMPSSHLAGVKQSVTDAGNSAFAANQTAVLGCDVRGFF